MTDTADSPHHLPSDEGLWFFIAADMVLFLLLFGSFSSEQAAARQAFDSAQQLLMPPLAMLNTLFLLTSSWFAASAVAAIRVGRSARARAYLGGTILLGSAFVITKISEYAIEVRGGVSLGSGGGFFAFYFIITGLHLVHVIGGMAFLGYIWRGLNAAPTAVSSVALMESGASFWHMVDVLWLVIFPLLYLLRW